MPVAPLILVVLLRALLWMFAIGSAARFTKEFYSAWIELALQTIAVAEVDVRRPQPHVGMQLKRRLAGTSPLE
jgi:hypothetical protein